MPSLLLDSVVARDCGHPPLYGSGLELARVGAVAEIGGDRLSSVAGKGFDVATLFSPHQAQKC